MRKDRPDRPDRSDRSDRTRRPSERDDRPGRTPPAGATRGPQAPGRSADPRGGDVGRSVARGEPGRARPDRPGPAPRGEPPRPAADLPRLTPGNERLEGRNVVLEALQRGRRVVRHIWLDAGARLDEKIQEILTLGGTRVQRIERTRLDRMSETGVHNGVIAEAEPLEQPRLRDLLDQTPEPFVVLVDEVQYEHNLGAVLRSSLGAGVDAVIVPVERGKGLSPVVARVAMGAAEVVPVIREGISASLAELRRRGVLVVGADMDGVPPWEVDLTGPVALVLGGEDKGLTDPVRKRCDVIVGVPLAGGLQSLNLSVTAGILLFERVRQRAAPSGLAPAIGTGRRAKRRAAEAALAEAERAEAERADAEGGERGGDAELGGADGEIPPMSAAESGS